MIRNIAVDSAVDLEEEEQNKRRANAERQRLIAQSHVGESKADAYISRFGRETDEIGFTATSNDDSAAEHLFQIIPIFLPQGNARRHIEERNPSSLTDQERSELRRVFDFFDLDGSGNLDVSELQQALARINCIVSEKQAIHLLREIDTDGNGKSETSCD